MWCMTTKPGEVYRVNLGIAGKVRLMVVMSRYDPEAPRALTLCAPITTQSKGSRYEVDIGRPQFLRQQSYVNVQGLQAIQHHELSGPIGKLDRKTIETIKAALQYALEL
jgi:mRNA interferase MazF